MVTASGSRSTCISATWPKAPRGSEHSKAAASAQTGVVRREARMDLAARSSCALRTRRSPDCRSAIESMTDTFCLGHACKAANLSAGALIFAETGQIAATAMQGLDFHG